MNIARIGAILVSGRRVAQDLFTFCYDHIRSNAFIFTEHISVRRSFSFEYILLIPFSTFRRNVPVLRNMTNCLVLRFLIVSPGTGSSHFSGYCFSYTDLSLLYTIIITTYSCLTLKRANCLASVKFPS